MSRNAELVALAGLLHDIGKFRQRAFWSERQNHEGHGRRWAEDRLLPRLQFLNEQERRQIAEAVEKHHYPRPYARDIRVVQLADRLASGERVPRQEEGTGDPSQELLIPVFAELRLDGRGPEGVHRWAYPTARLELGDQIFPGSGPDLHAEYKTLWDGFERELGAIPDDAPCFSDPGAFVLTWMSLLRVHAWCVPAAAYKDEPDVSLADHLHVTGALAACLWELPDAAIDRLEEGGADDQPVALLVGGDLSGIQRFLYTISSAGAAKSLRGRSAYLSLLCEAVAEYVRRDLDLFPCNVLYSGGGHFYLLAPLSSQERVQSLRDRITDLLLDLFGGEVAIVLASVQLKASDLRITPDQQRSPLGERWAELSGRLREAKQTLLREVAVSNPTRVFGPFGVGGRETFCVVCHSEPDQPEGITGRGLARPVRDAAEEAERKCSLCESFEDLSRALARARYLVLRRVTPRTSGELQWHSALTALGVELWLDDKPDLLTHYRKGDWVIRLNDPRVDPVVAGDRQVPVVGFRFLPNYTPLGEDGQIREIGEMAAASDGAPYFGSLRMDVDNLGRLFSEGLGGRLSLSRVATLSRSLATFFEGYLNRICEGLDSERKRLYLLYSGGDDLFAVGSWDRVLDLGETIRSKFRQYVCENPAVTLSGGAALHHEKFPLYQAAEQAGSYLESSKAWKRDGRSKNAFNMWGQVVEWEELIWARQWHDTVRSWLGGQKVRRAFVFKLARIASLYQERVRRRRWEYLVDEAAVRRRLRYERWLWTLVYYLAKESAELQPRLKELQQDLVDQERVRQLGLLARWVELSTRESSGGR
ncbi:MAG: type III-A CRISPR-associated protein Cas10/Csm1 [Armatimonadota bacterium]|nr:type III-A CRISPR-associated protein Cas10/Csm1 [Armatimonadota bacterium]MDR7472865.1 type III-A CRISPR-associated protein Cas10/Csm1 [Armatimonadota bacterium]MDR7583664.1 type III-A CRISPR-associated protein Cas10/Csm1 [Armatimonadota bacterium]